MRSFVLMPILALMIGAGGFEETSPRPSGVDVPFSLLPCDNDCTSCGFNQHMVYTSPAEGMTDTHTHGCLTQGSCEEHQECWPEEQEDLQVAAWSPSELGSAAETLRRAILEHDVETLRAALTSSEVEVRLTRGAVQVIGCDGLVVAHFPLPPTLVTSMLVQATQ